MPDLVSYMLDDVGAKEESLCNRKMPKIYLYAELLLNIRQITVFAILPSSCNESTQIELDADRKRLRLSHGDEEALIELPCSALDNANLKIPTVSTKELSFRLAISGSANLPGQLKPATDNTIPWPALKLTPETQLACGCCGKRLVTDVKVWKDLPSGGWADMMDFWHCHKPTTGNGNDTSAGSNKGYAASKILGPRAGEGLVDISYFLLAESDCTGIVVCERQLSIVFVNFFHFRHFPSHTWATRRRPASVVGPIP